MSEQDEKNFYDAVIIGGGPAGLSAALYLARARYRVLVIEKENFGGQITITSEVVNYPGIMKISGADLTNTMQKQAESFGAEFMLAEVHSFDISENIRKVKTSRGDISCFGILLATGAHPRMAGFRGESDFRGRGVAYCATCDGSFFSGKKVFVVGGGFAAAEESVFLTKYASHVTILIRSDDFSCAKATADAARNHPKISILTNIEVLEVAGDTMLHTLRYKNLKTNEVTEYHAPENDTFGLFVFAGYEPATNLVKDIVHLNEQGYIITDEKQKTNIDGIYAAGDVCVKELRQVVTAVSDGAKAATELERYAAIMQKKTGKKPSLPSVLNKEQPIHTISHQESDNTLLTEEMKNQLETVFSRMSQSLILRLYLDGRPVSAELKNYMDILASQTQKLSVEVAKSNSATNSDTTEFPKVEICLSDGTFTGLAFHGVPGGHEFTSFVLGLYNAAGPGQAIDETVREQIQKINSPIHLMIIVSLSCTMCPELVTAAQKLASESPFVSAEVYDINHFPELKEKYKIMSVPCMVINNQKVTFGKKNLNQILEFLL